MVLDFLVKMLCRACEYPHPVGVRVQMVASFQKDQSSSLLP